MKREIHRIVSAEPGLTGKEIAKRMKGGIDKTTVNRFLSENNEGLRKDKETGQWYLSEVKKHVLEIASVPWVTGDIFEECLQQSGCFFASDADEYLIKFPKGSSILLNAIARILSLLNQCAYKNKKVTLEFHAKCNSVGYLNRLGFFDNLDSRVTVLPQRPSESKAEKFKGNSGKLFEMSAVDPQHLDDQIPVRLTQVFTHNSSEDYYMAAFTVFSELIDNIEQHSGSFFSGFAALQVYKGKKSHIQTVVSDSGLGILQTLKPRLNEHYPDVHQSIDWSDKQADIDLLKKVFIDGHLSRFGSSEARGCGLNRSQNYAVKYNAEIIIRQETLELRLVFKDSELFESYPKFDLPIIYGTQVCFDFFLN
jgi:hypothetical protein